jgi:hypothetical protein
MPDSFLKSKNCTVEAVNDYKKLLDFLRSESFNLVYYALLNLDRFKTKEDAHIVLQFLNPDQDSRIREQASALIKDHMGDKKYNHYFNDENSLVFLTEAIKDKNPKVCKNITYTLQNINNRFMIIEKLVNIIEENIKCCNKEQIGNRTIFNIYWSLFAVENLLNSDTSTINASDKIIKILEETSVFREYQIRERTAAVVRLLAQNSNHDKVVHLYKQLSNDENFYVRIAISKMA